MPSSWKPEALAGPGDRRAHLRGRDAQAADRAPSTSTRTSAARSTAASRRREPRPRPPSTRPPGRSCSTQGQPIVTYFSSSSGGRTRDGAGGLLGREAGAVPRRPSTIPTTRSRRTTTGRSRSTTATSRRRPSTPGSSPASTSTRTRRAASARVTLNGSAGPLELGRGARAQALRAALDLVHRSRPRSGLPRATDDLAARARRAQPRAAERARRRRARRRCRAPRGYGWRDLVVARRRPTTARVSFRRPVGESSRYRLVAGSLATPRVPVDPQVGPAPARAPGRAAARAAVPGAARAAPSCCSTSSAAAGRGSRARRRARDGTLPLPACARRAVAGACAGAAPARSSARARPSSASARALARLDAHRSARGARVEPRRRQRVRLRRRAAGRRSTRSRSR